MLFHRVKNGTEIALPSVGRKAMKKLIMTLLFTGGLLMAATPESAIMHQKHVGHFQKIALRTQSPAVHFRHMKNGERNADYKVLQNKRTIVALIPYGK
jgi:hypothetical protein